MGLAVLVCGVVAWAQGYTPVTVVVTGPDGAAVAGAEIRVTPGSPAGDKLITDEQGRAQLGMPAGEYKLHVTAQGFAGADKTLVVADKAADADGVAGGGSGVEWRDGGDGTGADVAGCGSAGDDGGGGARMRGRRRNRRRQC